MNCKALAIIVVIIVAVLSSFTGAAEPVSAIHLRLYDYAAVPTETLTHTQRLVSRIYRDAGIGTIWEPTLTLDAALDPTPVEYVPVADVSIMLLSADMSRRQDADRSVIGRAAVTGSRPGRIAYVHVERVRRIAAGSAETPEILGYVIAHELGHLLLPPGSHTDSGLMRGRWTEGELRRVAGEDFALTGSQRRSLQQQARAFRAAASR